MRASPRVAPGGMPQRALGRALDRWRPSRRGRGLAIPARAPPSWPTLLVSPELPTFSVIESSGRTLALRWAKAGPAQEYLSRRHYKFLRAAIRRAAAPLGRFPFPFPVLL